MPSRKRRWWRWSVHWLNIEGKHPVRQITLSPRKNPRNRRTYNANNPPQGLNVHPASATTGPTDPHIPISPPASPPPHPHSVSTNPAPSWAAPSPASKFGYVSQRDPSPNARAAAWGREYRPTLWAAGRCAPRRSARTGDWSREGTLCRKQGDLGRLSGRILRVGGWGICERLRAWPGRNVREDDGTGLGFAVPFVCRSPWPELVRLCQSSVEGASRVRAETTIPQCTD